MPLTLYCYPFACSLASRALLIEGKFDYVAEYVDVSKPVRTTSSGEDYWKINPRGAVPTLVTEDGEIITQGGAVLQYLGYRSKLPGMHPAPGTMEHTRLVEALSFVSDLHNVYSPLFNPTLTPEERKSWEAKVDTRMGQLEKWLEANDQEYWLGDVPTQADFYVAVCINWATPLGKDLSAYKRSVALKNKIFARPSFVEAVKDDQAHHAH